MPNFRSDRQGKPVGGAEPRGGGEGSKNGIERVSVEWGRWLRWRSGQARSQAGVRSCGWTRRRGGRALVKYRERGSVVWKPKGEEQSCGIFEWERELRSSECRSSHLVRYLTATWAFDRGEITDFEQDFTGFHRFGNPRYAMSQLDSRDLIANQSRSQDFGDPSTVRDSPVSGILTASEFLQLLLGLRLLQEKDPSFSQCTALGDFSFGFERSGILVRLLPQETSVLGRKSAEYLVLERSGMKLSASSSGVV